MDGKAIFADLRAQLSRSRVQTIYNQKFVPKSVLHQIFTNDSIRQAVIALNCADEDRIGLTRTIEEEGLTTFAILVCMCFEDAIVEFRRARCLDSRLPMGAATLSKIAPSIGDQFCEVYQWQFLPHFFSRRDGDVVVEQSAIIPIVREIELNANNETEPEVNGGFGRVTRIEIHASLHDLGSFAGQNPLFVRKRLYERGTAEQRRELFKSEKRTLRLLNCLNHPNITPLLYAYTYGKEYNFLFPCVETDLSRFLEQDVRLGEFRWDFTFFSAMYGLTSALSNLHQIEVQATEESPAFSGIGYHHDLRPANILVSNETFILADFGLSKLKPSHEQSHTRWKAGTGDYLAPECMDDQLNHQRTGRTIDVWAIGCLIAEVITYMSMGREGLIRFRQVRFTPGSFANWENAYFYDSTGTVKRPVHDWLRALRDSNPATPLGSMCRLVLKLLTPATQRPTLTYVCSYLTFVNLQAHLSAVLKAFEEILETSHRTDDVGTVSMKLWFESERLRAIERVLSLQSAVDHESGPSPLDVESGTVVEICKRLFELIEDERSTVRVAANRASDDMDQSETVSGEFVSSGEERRTEKLQIFEVKAQRLVQKLWDALPEAGTRKAEKIWVDSMIRTYDVERLENMNRILRLQPTDMYQTGAAVALMKQIRLELVSATDIEKGVEELQLSSRDVIEGVKSNGHQLGECRALPVIIEWMYYDPSWDSISPRERTLVMSLKAQGFNITPRPKSLRLLQCLGFFERDDKLHPGYGFAYQMPRKKSQSIDRVETLLSLLLLSRKVKTDPNLNQPLLGDKFILGYTLASFLWEFHSIGWLHENFCSQNIVFFDSVPDGEGINPSSSEILTRPYILGLHKSRPGGDAWHTEGPKRNQDYLDYQHPDYTTTERFRYSYDYYSLGLVLLEIGLWTPLRAWSNDRRYRGMDPHQFRDQLLQIYVPRLGPRMGKQYHDVVKTLLTDAIDPDSKGFIVSEERERHVFNRFFDEILDPLAKLSETHP